MSFAQTLSIIYIGNINILFHDAFMNHEQRLLNEIDDFFRKTIFPYMDTGQFVTGSAHSFTPSHPQFNKVKFIAWTDNRASLVAGTTPRKDGTKWGLVIFSTLGGEPFRIEEHNGKAHINTANKSYDHITLDIPEESLRNYGAVGSAAMGYYRPQGPLNMEYLLRKHLNAIIQDNEAGSGKYP